MSHARNLFEPVLTVHAGALVHVGLGDVVAPAGCDTLLDALADKAAHEEGTALDAPVGLGVPGELFAVRHAGSPSARCIFRARLYPHPGTGPSAARRDRGRP